MYMHIKLILSNINISFACNILFKIFNISYIIQFLFHKIFMIMIFVCMYPIHQNPRHKTQYLNKNSSFYEKNETNFHLFRAQRCFALFLHNRIAILFFLVVFIKANERRVFTRPNFFTISNFADNKCIDSPTQNVNHGMETLHGIKRCFVSLFVHTSVAVSQTSLAYSSLSPPSLCLSSVSEFTIQSSFSRFRKLGFRSWNFIIFIIDPL